jgi:hypothetical protein
LRLAAISVRAPRRLSSSERTAVRPATSAQQRGERLDRGSLLRDPKDDMVLRFSFILPEPFFVDRGRSPAVHRDQ